MLGGSALFCYNRRMEDQRQKIEELKIFFADRPEVQMAFLFGSQAENRARRTSDWDIGVFLTEENRDMENEIWSAVSKITKSEVDFVVLNRAPATIAWRITGQGEILVIKDRKKYLDFIFKASEEANAFYKTVMRYDEIFQRSQSLAIQDKEYIIRIVEFLEEEIKDYPQFKKLTWPEYNENRTKKREVEHWIEHLVVAIIDIAETILASERRPVPATYHEIIELLGIIGSFRGGDLCEKIAPWTSLRNILAHEYLDYRWDKISRFIKETEPLWVDFIKKAREFISPK